MLQLLKEFDAAEFSGDPLSSKTDDGSGDIPVEAAKPPERKLYTHCEVSLARMSLCITEPVHVPGAGTGAAASSFDTIFNAVIYGIYARFEALEEDENEVVLRIGSLRTFGGKSSSPVVPRAGDAAVHLDAYSSHVELLALGDVSAAVEGTASRRQMAISLRLHSSHCMVAFTDSRTRTLRRQHQHQHQHQHSIGSAGGTGVGARHAKPPMGPESQELRARTDAGGVVMQRRKHVVVELSVAPLRFYWDQPTMLFLRNICFSLMTTMPSVAEVEAPRLAEVRRMLGYSRAYAAAAGTAGGSEALMRAEKYSVEVVLQGCVVNIPYDHTIADYATATESAAADSAGADAEQEEDEDDGDSGSSLQSSEYGDSDESSVMKLDSDDDDDFDDSDYPVRRGGANRRPRSQQSNASEFVKFVRDTDSLRGGVRRTSLNSATALDPVWNDVSSPQAGALPAKEELAACVFPRRVPPQEEAVENPIIFQFSVGRVTVAAGDFLENSMAAVRIHNAAVLQQQEQDQQDQHSQHVGNAGAGSGGDHVTPDGSPSPFVDVGTPAAPVQDETLSWADEADVNICAAMDRMKAPFMRTMSCSVADVNMQFVKRMTEKEVSQVASVRHAPASLEPHFKVVRHLSTVPWCIKGLASQTELPFHPVNTDLRLDLFMSPLQLSMSTQDMIAVINSVRSIEDVLKVPKALFPAEERAGAMLSEEKRSGDVAVVDGNLRLARFAGLSKLHVSALFDHIHLTLVEPHEDATNAPALLIAQIFKSYSAHLLSRAGNKVRVAKCYRRISVHRLCQMGIKRQLCEQAMEKFMASVLELPASAERGALAETLQAEAVQNLLVVLPGLDHLNAERDTAKSPSGSLADKFRSAVNSYVREEKSKTPDTQAHEQSHARTQPHLKFKDLVTSLIKTDHRVPMASFDLKGLSLHLHELTYDRRVTAVMREFRMSDQHRNPILLIYNKNAKGKAKAAGSGAGAGTGSGKHDRAHGGHNPRHSARKHRQSSGAHASVVSGHPEDHDINVANAVVFVSFVDRDCQHGFGTGTTFGVSPRRQDIEAKMMHVECYLSRSGIPRILEQVLPAIHRVTQHSLVTAYAYERHQHLLGSTSMIPQLGYENVFDVVSMNYIDICSIGTYNERRRRLQASEATRRTSASSPSRRSSISPVLIKKLSVTNLSAVEAEAAKLSVVVHVACGIQNVVLVLADEDKLFAEINLSNVHVSQRPGQIESGNGEGSGTAAEAMLTNVAVDTIKVYDLTTMGGMHSQFMWTLGGGAEQLAPQQGPMGDLGPGGSPTPNGVPPPAKRTPAVVVKHTSQDKWLGFFRADEKNLKNLGVAVPAAAPSPETVNVKSPMGHRDPTKDHSPAKPAVVVPHSGLVSLTREFNHLVINVHGVGCCFLFRFYEELMAFIFTKMLNPIKAAVQIAVIPTGDLSGKILDSTVLGLNEDDYAQFCQKVQSSEPGRHRRRRHRDDGDGSDGYSDGSYDGEGSDEYLSSGSEYFSDSDEDSQFMGKFRTDFISSPSGTFHASDTYRTPTRTQLAESAPLGAGASPFMKPKTAEGQKSLTRRRSSGGMGSRMSMSGGYRSASPVSLEPLAPRVRDSEMKIDIHIFDTSVVMPRNSANEDLVGLTVKHVHVSFYPVEESWSGLKERREVPHFVGEDVTLHFDTARNDWVFKDKPLVPVPESEPSIRVGSPLPAGMSRVDSFGLPVVRVDEESPTVPFTVPNSGTGTGTDSRTMSPEHSSRSQGKAQTLSKLFGILDEKEDEEDECAGQTFLPFSGNTSPQRLGVGIGIGNVSAGASAGVGSVSLSVGDEDDLSFFDALESSGAGDMSANGDSRSRASSVPTMATPAAGLSVDPLDRSNLLRSVASSAPGDELSYFRALDFHGPPKSLHEYEAYEPVKTEFDSKYLRHTIKIESVSLFVCLHSPINVGTDGNHHDREESSSDDKKFSKIRPMHPVYVSSSGRSRKGMQDNHGRAHGPGHGHGHHHHTPRKDGSSAQSATMQMKWRQVSLMPFDLALVLDLDRNEVMRTLISDTECYTPIALKATMGEFYMLMSVYFDNICELPQFFPPPASISGEGATASAASAASATAAGESAPRTPLPEYGTPAYLEYLRNRSGLSEGGFLMVCSKLSLDLSMDLNYFPNNLHSLPYLLRNNSNKELVELISASLNCHNKTERQSKWSYQSLPILNIALERWVVQSMFDGEVTQTGVGAFSVAISDLRSPAQTCQPLLIQASAPLLDTMESDENFAEGDGKAEGMSSARKEFYGYIDFDFGLYHNPSCVKSGEPVTDIPFQLTTYSSTRSNWTTTNIGLDFVDINIFNLDMIWLAADLFAGYFNAPEFGNPAAAAYAALPKQAIEHPYGGADTRVFATRPHIAVMENPTTLATQSLHLETDFGIYYRNVIDSNGSTNTEVNLTEMAMVLLKQYKQPCFARGLRGAAGSGSGVRTQIEYLSASVVHHYDALKNNFDLLVDVAPIDPAEDPSQGAATQQHAAPGHGHGHSRAQGSGHAPGHGRGSRGDSFVYFDAEYPKIESKSQFEPVCVFPLASSSRKFPENSCDIVTSYEDLLLTIALIQKLIDFTAPKPAPRPVAAPEGQQSRRRSINTPSKELAAILAAHESGATEAKKPPTKFELASQYSVIHLRSIRCIVVDNVLGLHLPLLQMFIDELNFNSHRALAPEKKPEPDHNRSSMQFEGVRRASIKSKAGLSVNASDAPPEIIEPVFESVVYVQLRTWVEYFSNVLKCWECLIEPVCPVILYENHPQRGEGYTLRFISSVHINLTGALLRATNDILRMINSSNENIHNRKGLDAAGGATVDDPKPEPVVEQERAITRMATILTPGEAVSSSSGAGRKATQASAKVLGRHMRRRASGGVASEPTSPQDVKLDYHTGVFLQHIPFHSLSDDTRVGFSILNLTGQSVRYLQAGGGGRLLLQYIAHGQRGALNFVPSTTLIRNNQIMEEEFNVQRVKVSKAGAGSNSPGATRVLRTGHQVALQVSGYKWLQQVQADTLGLRCEPVEPVIGRVKLSAAFMEDNERNRRILNATMLVMDVRPHNGGRLLTLKSTFRIQNNTTHPLHVLTLSGEKQKLNAGKASTSYGQKSTMDSASGEQVFLLESGESFNIPLSFLHQSALLSNAKSLGNVYIKPSDITPVKNELLGKIKLYPDKVSYTMEPVDLLDVVTAAEDKLNNLINSDEGEGAWLAKDQSTTLATPQLCCQVTPKSKQAKNSNGAEETENTSVGSGRLPPFCYTVEIRRNSTGNVGAFDENGAASTAEKSNIKQFASHLAERFFFSKDRAQSVTGDPASYVIIVHPPIILENLLPSGGKFTLMHPIHEVVLWSGWIGAGMVQAVHSVTLEEPLVLLINLKYCRSTEGILVHKPPNMNEDSNAGIAIAAAVKSTIEGLLDDEESSDASFFLTDAHGQRLRLHIQNSLGGGGQRHIAVYCPYWIVNSSQYAVRIREEGDVSLPAGTVTAQK